MAFYLGNQKVSGVITEYSTTAMDTTDATATEADVLSPKTFYAGNQKKTGSLKVSNIYIMSSGDIPDNVDELGENGDFCLFLK